MPAPRRNQARSRDPEDRFRTADDEEESGSGNLFGWTVFILILCGVAIACWIGSFYIFGHPEKALSYSILTNLKKLDPPKRFELTAAPRGEFLTADKIRERYGSMTPRELQKANEILLRNYLRNFKLASGLVPYVVGTFNILDSYELTDQDFFESGVVALSQSRETPDVLLEQIFSASPEVVPALHRTLLTGLDIDLKRQNELATIINVSRLDDGRLKVTAISILYPSYESTTASGMFTLEPPELLNVAAGLPVVTTGKVREADAKYASYRQRAGLPPVVAAGGQDPAQSRLMRVERPVAVNLPTQPEIPVAPAAPVLPDDAPVRVALPVTPEATPAPELPPDPAAVAAVVPPGPVPAESPAMPPTVEPTPAAEPSPSPAAIAATTGGSWPVYAPGQMPRGRLLGVREMPEMAGRELGGERVYLEGKFIVTASGPNRAVLRNQGAIASTLGFGSSSANVRVIVEYPSGARPPAEGSSFSRDARRPFQITQIRPGGADGQVNVYVREVTRP